MISIKTLLECNHQQAIQALVKLYSEHYSHPGYILNREKLTNAFEQLCNKLQQSIPNYNLNVTIDIVLDQSTGTYTLSVDNMLFRDWYRQENYPGNILTYQISAPKELNKEQLLAELLFEITYYKLPQIS